MHAFTLIVREHTVDDRTDWAAGAYSFVGANGAFDKNAWIGCTNCCCTATVSYHYMVAAIERAKVHAWMALMREHAIP